MVYMQIFSFLIQRIFSIIQMKELWLAVIGTAITITYTVYQTNKQKERATVSLYEYYHSVEFYSKVRAPFWEIQMKWLYYAGQQRADYHRAVLAGWINYRNPAYLEPLPKRLSRYDRCYVNHHIKFYKKTGLTEHQILTMGIKFWATLNILRKENHISKTNMHIFKSEYGYISPFLSKFRKELTQELQKRNTPHINYPGWIQETEELDRYFNKLITK